MAVDTTVRLSARTTSAVESDPFGSRRPGCPHGPAEGSSVKYPGPDPHGRALDLVLDAGGGPWRPSEAEETPVLPASGHDHGHGHVRDHATLLSLPAIVARPRSTLSLSPDPSW